MAAHYPSAGLCLPALYKRQHVGDKPAKPAYNPVLNQKISQLPETV
jgi:hypothetical protein